MRESGYKKKQKLQKEGDNKKNQMLLLHEKQKDWLKNKQKLNCNGKLK
jgi:hypothetical protein